MTYPRLAKFALGLAAVLAFQALGHAQAPKKKPTRALPPKWSKEVTDVFFPDARKVLVGDRPAPGKPGAKTVATASNPQPAAGGGEAAAGGVFAWSKIIAPEALEDEIKAQKLQLDESVKTLGPFKGGTNKDARKQFSTLAVMFAIVGEYDGQVRWRKDAPGIRELVAQAGFSCKVGTDQAFAQSKLRIQELNDLVGGGSIAGLKAADAKAEWPKVTNRAPLMMRLEDAFDKKLKPWLASEAEFKSHAEQVLHEAQVLAAISEVIQREGFEFADDETYIGYAKAMRQAASDIAEAVKLNSYEKANTASGAIANACSECHGGYRS